MFKILMERFSKRKRLAKKQPQVLRYEELEQRVLFSADVVPGLDTAAVEEQVIVQDVTSEVQVEREAASETVEQTAEEKRSELVLVNENVADHEQLIADLQGSDNNRIIEVVVLESDRDGIEQVSQILAERQDLDAIHIITHGSDGSLALSNDWLDSDDLTANSEAIRAWGDAFSEDADILLYGCNIADGEDGQNLTDTLAELTGADVAASDDKTGHEDLGGDWELEYVSGTVETGIAVNETGQQEWEGLLATYTVADDFSSGDFTGSTGSASWTGDWITSGGIVLTGGEMRINVVNSTAARQVDLSLAVTASLSFDFHTGTGIDAEDPDSIVIEISNNGGTDWTTLEDINYLDGANSGTSIYDISSHATANTQIRFRAAIGYGGPDEFFYVDNVVIAYSDTNSAPVITSNGGGDTASISIEENTTAVTTVTATDLNGSDTPTYSINGGVDYKLFTINSVTGELSFKTAPDYENPADNYGGIAPGFNPDNIYEVHVAVSDGNGGTDTQAISVTVTTVNDNAPVINDLTTSVAEDAANSTVVTNINEANTGNDTDLDGTSLTYSITAGNADGIFAIDANTGEISVADNTNLDYEATQQYVLTVQASDGTNTDAAAVTIDVSNVSDSISGTAFIDEGVTNIGAGKTINVLVNGVSVGTSITAADGSYTVDTGVINAGDAVVLFIDNDATYKGVTVTIADGSDLSGTDVFADHVMVRHEGGGALTMADMDTALGGHSDTDIGYSVTAGALTITGGELYVPAGHTFTPDGDITIQGSSGNIEINGTLNGGSNTLTVSGDWDSKDGTFNYDTSTLKMTGVGKTLTQAAGWVDRLYNLTIGNGASITHAGGVSGIANDITIEDNASLLFTIHTFQSQDSGTGDLIIGNNATLDIKYKFYHYITDASNHISTTGTIKSTNDTGVFYYAAMTGNTAAPITARTYDLDVAITGASDAVSVLSGGASMELGSHDLLLWDSGQLAYYYGTLDNPFDIPIVSTGALEIADKWDNATFTGSLIARSADYEFGSVILRNGSGLDAATGAGASNWTVSGNVTLNAGSTFDAGGSTWNIAGDWIRNGGSFTAGTSTVNLTGGDQAILGSTNFYNLSKTEASNDGTDVTLTFDNTGTQTVTGTLTLDGLDDDDRINLVSDSLGDQWSLVLDAGATKVIDYVDVQDSDASGSDPSQKPIDALNAVDSGNNTDWFDYVAPSQVNNTGSTISEGGTDTLTNTELRYDDSEQPASNVAYNVTGGLVNGQLELTTNLGVSITTFTQAQIDAGQVVYVHNGSNTTSDSFNFSVDDSRGNTLAGQSFALTITPVNDAPVVSAQVFAVAENSVNNTVIGTVAASDPEPGDTLTYSITGGNTGGAFAIDPSTGQITVANSAALDFEVNPSFALSVQVQDDGTGNLTDSATVTVNLTDVNLSFAGTAFATDGVTPLGAGTTVRLLVNGSNAGTGVTAADGSFSVNTEANAGDLVLLFLDNDPANKGTTVTVSDGGNLSGITVRADHVIVRHDNGGVLTNADMAAALGAYSDTDIGYSVSGGVVTVTASWLEVAAGHSFTLTGDASVQGIRLLGTLDADSYTITVTDDWDAGNGTFTAGSSTIVIGTNGQTSTITTDPAAGWSDAALNNVTVVAGSHVDFSMGTGSSRVKILGHLEISGTLEVQGGQMLTLAYGQNRLTINAGGELTGAGVFERVVDDVPVHIVNNGTISVDTFQYGLRHWGTDPMPVTATTYGNNLIIKNWGSLDWDGVLGRAPGDTTSDLVVGGTLTILHDRVGMTLSLDNSVDNIDIQVGNLVVGDIGNDAVYAYFNAGSATITVAGDVIIAGVDVPGSNVIDADSSTWNVGGNWTNNDTFNAQSSTVVIGTNGQSNTITTPATGLNTFYNLTINPGAQISVDALDTNGFQIHGLLTISGTFEIPQDIQVWERWGGTLTINAGGELTGLGTFTRDVEDDPNPITNDGTISIDTFVYQLRGWDDNIAEAVTATTYGNNLTIKNLGSVGRTGVLTGAGDLVVGGTLKIYDDRDGPSIILDNTVNNIDVTAGNLVIGDSSNPNAYGVFRTGSGTITVNGDLIIEASDGQDGNNTLEASGGAPTIYVAGSWTDNDTFTAGTSTVTFNGTGQSISGDSTFYNFQKSITSADVLTFAAGSTQSMTGLVMLRGISGNLLSLCSDTPGSTWNFVLPSGAATAIDYVDVQDSDASGSDPSQKPIDPPNAVDSGNNTDWFDYVAPVQVNNTGSTVTEGGTDTLTNGELRYDDSVQPASSVTYTVTGGLTNGQLELIMNLGVSITTFTQAQVDAGQVVYVHDGTNTTTDSFNFSVDDGRGNTLAGQNFILTITPVNDAPAGADHTVSTAEDTDYVFVAGDFGFTDPNDSPADNFANVIITTTVANGTLYVDANANGIVDGGEALNDLDTVSVADISEGRLKFKPAANANGTGYDSFTFQVVDDAGGADTDLTPNTMIIDVTPVNDMPVVTSASLTVSEGQTVTLSGANFGITDADDASFTYTLSAISGGYFQLSSAAGTPITSFTSADLTASLVQFVDNGDEVAPSFSVTVNDGDVDSNTLAATISYTPVNDTPVVNNATFALNENSTNGTAVGSVPVTDPDAGDTHVYSITAGNIGGAFAIDNAGNITVANSAALDFETTPVFTLTVQVQDQGGAGLIDTATIIVNLNNLNEAPTTSGIANVTVGEDAPNTVIDLFAAFADTEDADANLTYTITANTNPALFAATLIDGVTGILTLDYAPNAYGTAGITVRATDTSALWVESTFTVTVNPVNDTPTTSGIADISVDEDAADSVVDLFAAFSDVEELDSALTYTITNNTNPGLFASTTIDGVAGSLTLNYAADQNGSSDITVRATDTGGQFVETTFTVTVNPVNDNDPADSTDPNPILEDPEADDDEDSDVENPTYEAPGEGPLAEDEPLLLVEEYLAPEFSGDADDSFVLMKDPQDEETEEIIYLTDEIDRNTQSEGREDDRGYTYYDNDLYKDMSSLKYWNLIDYNAQNEPVVVSLDDVGFLDFDSDDTDPVGVNGDYDALRQEIDESFNSELKSQGIKAKIVTATAATFTVGIVSYLLRAGSMVASMMSALPLWRGFDPIAIFSGNKKKKKKQDEISDAGELKPESFFDGDAE